VSNVKKTCFGCKALEYSKIKVECLLNYPFKMKDKTPLLPEPVPLNKNCPKPRTHKDLFELLGLE